MATKRKKREQKPKTRKCSVRDAVADGFSEIACLAEEMRGWADNIEEKFSATQKYQDVSDCADALENVSESEPTDIPDELLNTEIEYPLARGSSRAARRDECCDMWQTAIDFLQDKRDDEESGLTDEQKDAIDSFVQELESAKGDVEYVDFPGMY